MEILKVDLLCIMEDMLVKGIAAARTDEHDKKRYPNDVESPHHTVWPREK
jgi:hypothetical protein